MGGCVPGDLGIALTDTFTSKAFYDSFDKKFAKLFDGVRHDSGDPIEFASQTIEHYERLGINPLSKTIIFSDALTPEKVERIQAFARIASAWRSVSALTSLTMWAPNP
ncbi:hypothetical protein HORIV_46600 [Vreelandella olivaria]|uniref:Nicotinate/nicotinamide phosphoribosyltransferase domain-containing protein n=1 Tax=Vreelandella olivaria TaxID=390919 RepID=A0ABN5WZ45_9GAMM|nr:hypothetical protein HORIV_46600 [Halomonas olivaria]